MFTVGGKIRITSQLILFIDLKQALQSASREAIYKKRKIFSDKHLNILKFIDSKTKLKVDNIEAIATDGVPQGHIMSPFEFLVFIDELFDFLDEKLSAMNVDF